MSLRTTTAVLGSADRARQALERLLRDAPSAQALAELIRFVEGAGMWSDDIAAALRAVVYDPADRGYTQITALNLVIQHTADDDFVSGVARKGASERCGAALSKHLSSVSIAQPSSVTLAGLLAMNKN